MSGNGKLLSSSCLVWYRNTDLRLHDHEPLTIAHSHHVSVGHIYIFDPRTFGDSTVDFSKSIPKTGWPKTGHHRTRFLLESVLNLKNNLAQKSNPAGAQELAVSVGYPEVILAQVAQELKVSHIYCHEAEAPEELIIQNNAAIQLSQCGAKLVSVWGNTMYHVEDLPFSTSPRSKDFPVSSSAFRTQVEKQCRIRASLPVPAVFRPVPRGLSAGVMPSLVDLCGRHANQLTEPDRRGVMHFCGGETAALQRVQDYIWDKDCLRNYFSTRNGMVGPNYSSKLSPWLSAGNYH
jgi:deoxyribodipyrimidine photo-lyase